MDINWKFFRSHIAVMALGITCGCLISAFIARDGDGDNGIRHVGLDAVIDVRTPLPEDLEWMRRANAIRVGDYFVLYPKSGVRQKLSVFDGSNLFPMVMIAGDGHRSELVIGDILGDVVRSVSSNGLFNSMAATINRNGEAVFVHDAHVEGNWRVRASVPKTLQRYIQGNTYEVRREGERIFAHGEGGKREVRWSGSEFEFVDQGVGEASGK